MQVDPIKPTLKVPETKRLKLKYDEPLSSFAFHFNLRRYSEEHAGARQGPPENAQKKYTAGISLNRRWFANVLLEDVWSNFCPGHGA